LQKYSTLFILLIFLSCSGNSNDELPSGVLPLPVMTDIFTDIQLAEALVKAKPHAGDTDARTVRAYYGFIYKKYGVTDSAFMHSYDYYAHHPVLLDSVFAEVVNRLNDRQAGLKAN
jgi:hypothetical protein